MKKIIKRVALLALFGALCVWGSAVLRCEWLTARYISPEMIVPCEQLLSSGAFERVKLLEYDPYGYAELYGRHDDMGNFFRIAREADGSWQVVAWKTVWSAQGSADEIIWPYFR